MAKYEVLKKNELSSGQMRALRIENRELLVARANDRYLVSEARCPHLGGKLAEGKLEGTIVTCPLHGSQFDLQDGKVLRWTNWSGALSKIGQAVKSPRPLKTYAVTLEGDSVMVEL